MRVEKCRGVLGAVLMLVVVTVTVTACERNTAAPLTPRQKADYLLEVIPLRAECEPLRERLRAAPDDKASVERVYADALKTRCTHREL